MSQFKQLRLESNLTQADVAGQLGLSDKSTIAKWEANESLPRAEMLPKIATLYNCTPEQIMAAISAAKQQSAS